MVLDTLEGVFSGLKQKIRGLRKREPIWLQFKLVITNPPRYAGHFELIKSELVPFVKKHSLEFWVTNYHDTTNDFILFRIKSTESQSKPVEDFLNGLKTRKLIVDWERSTWDPKSDAQARIEGLRKIKTFDPSVNAIVGYDSVNGTILVLPDTNIRERQAQLEALFEDLGKCTKVIYDCFDSKPKDLWTMSLFLHLLLNSLDFSGPDPPSEEHNIRTIPPL
jgi:hypothetical protein